MTAIKLRIGTKIALGIVSIMLLYLATLLFGYQSLDVLTEIIQEVHIGKLSAASAFLEADKAIHTMMQRTVTLILFTIIVSCGFGYLVVIGIMRPVRQLLTGAEAIGGGNLKYRVPPMRTGDELDDLGRKFNDMALQLENTMVSLDQLEVTEAALRESKARYERAINGTHDGLFDWDLQINQVYFSPRWKIMLGYAEGEIDDDPENFFRHVHPDDVKQLRKSIASHIEQPGQYLVSEHRMQNKDGNYRWVQCRALAIDETGAGRATRLSGSQTDIHLRKLAEQQLVFETLHDMLTRLPNRNLLLDRLQHSIELAKRHRSG
ncbi:MAG: PAS domain-containing protein, partial [Gammaproteobacteria bacterium]